MAKKHLVVAKKADGTVASYRMKDWLRHNPEFVPDGLDPNTNTTHELRRGLTQQGWILHEKTDKVILIRPHDERVATKMRFCSF
jgi:endonuclease